MNPSAASNAERESLLKEQALILLELTALKDAVRHEIDADPDEGDADISERSKDVALITILEHTLDDIQKALHAIDSGHYGICERCQNQIPPERMEAKPDATLCVACQRNTEQIVHRNYVISQSLHRRPSQDGWADEIQS